MLISDQIIRLGVCRVAWNPGSAHPDLYSYTDLNSSAGL